MTVERAWSGTVEPDYFQFYLRRAGAPWASDAVSEPGYAARLWTDGGFVYVGTARQFGTTPVDVDVTTAPPGPAAPSWQHVAEVSLESGGAIEVLSWGADDPVVTIDVDGGPLRLRVSWTGLVAERFEGMEADGSSDERLAITIWPAPAAPAEVVRRWDGWPW
jgi:hypothetical protein